MLSSIIVPSKSVCSYLLIGDMGPLALLYNYGIFISWLFLFTLVKHNLGWTFRLESRTYYFESSLGYLSSLNKLI